MTSFPKTRFVGETHLYHFEPTPYITAYELAWIMTLMAHSEPAQRDQLVSEMPYYVSRHLRLELIPPSPTTAADRLLKSIGL